MTGYWNRRYSLPISYTSLALLKDSERSLTTLFQQQRSYLKNTRVIKKLPKLACYMVVVSLKNPQIYQLWTTVLKLRLRLQCLWKCEEYANLQWGEAQHRQGVKKKKIQAFQQVPPRLAHYKVCNGILLIQKFFKLSLIFIYCSDLCEQNFGVPSNQNLI